MLEGIESYWREVVSGQRNGGWATAFKGFLFLLSLPYRAVVAIRNYTYDKGWLKTYRIPNATVVSIGNIVVGGSGKTPVVAALAEALAEEKVAILSRGYRSKAETLAAPSVIPPLDADAAFYGDEPTLLAKRLPKAMVIVGRDRVQSARVATQARCRLLLLDDGMQHRRLARDIEVVVVEASDPLGGEVLLPAGRLREPPSALRRADAIILSGVVCRAQYQQATRLLAQYSNAPTIGMKLEVSKREGQIPLKGVKVGAFCGLAQPDKFIQTLHEVGADVVATLLLADHMTPNEEELAAFAERAKPLGASLLLCTEKDYVKLNTTQHYTLPIDCVKVDLVPVEDKENWQALIDNIND